MNDLKGKIVIVVELCSWCQDGSREELVSYLGMGWDDVEAFVKDRDQCAGEWNCWWRAQPTVIGDSNAATYSKRDVRFYDALGEQIDRQPSSIEALETRFQGRFNNTDRPSRETIEP